MTSNVAYERSFAELSNGHGFSMVRVITLAKIIKTICSVFFWPPLLFTKILVEFEMVKIMCFWRWKQREMISAVRNCGLKDGDGEPKPGSRQVAVGHQNSQVKRSWNNGEIRKG